MAAAGFVGYVDGQIQEEGREVHFWGGRLLLACALSLVVIGVIKIGVSGVQQLIGAFLPIVLILLVVAFVAMRSERGSKITSGVMHAGVSVARGAARASAAGARGSAGVLSRSTMATFTIRLRRFRIRDVMGNVTSCVLVGDVNGDLMRQGDLVRVIGRRNRQHVVMTHRVQVLDAIDRPARLTVLSRQTFGYRLSQVLDVIAKAASAGLIVIIVGLLAGWIR